MYQGLNSHYFHIIGDGHQPNSRGLYTHYKGFLLKVGWPSLINIATFDHGTYRWGSVKQIHRAKLGYVEKLLQDQNQICKIWNGSKSFLGIFPFLGGCFFNVLAFVVFWWCWNPFNPETAHQSSRLSQNKVTFTLKFRAETPKCLCLPKTLQK